ncbi:glutathione synthetase-like isoform X1 [Tigriopus californicus]|uniref:glutathione synthetase-like isoform X1 n=1 Tax=Tigriopus californicus TaxID=6832 RepID=UPI0027DAB24A|nr:glutathione synthetase-like isoform X1 [Tigriopus californicus]|eukprot:TCALIF_05110-PA protein Name:"Similar to gss Glutathione synthetase (Xenopus laevis)" AED:0.09 eAED:0.09 QI:350/0.71/0.87/1/1/1/8/448/496
MDSCVPLPMEPKVLQEITEKAKDYALMHGICMRRKDAFDRDALHFAPFLLLPSAFPKGEFERACQLQTILNELMHKVAHDREFLIATLAQTVKVDEFTRRLVDIYNTVAQEGVAQPLSLGLLRSDLMLNVGPCDGPAFCCWHQVEINTIASGFGWLGPASGLIHRFVLGELGRKDLLDRIPENNSLSGLSGAMLEAHKIYNQPKAVILFIVEDVTYNICDQKFHEFKIREMNPDVFVERKTLTEVANEGHLDNQKRLFVDGKEIAVIYFRCGYSPDQYPSEREWDARLMMERSMAIKSPSIHYHLAGTKKVQQELALPGTLERFCDDPEKIKSIKSIFTGLYTLDKGEEGDKSVAMAMKNPERFVLKPQREGGGNNTYGDDIPPFLESIKDSEERNAYILMDRILPPKTMNYVVRPGHEKAELKEVISELGIFGYVIGDQNRIISNHQVGHMLRTKLSHVNEGGVAAGLGALDSVFLVDVEKCCEAPCTDLDGCCQ